MKALPLALIILSLVTFSAGCIGQGITGSDAEPGESGFISAGAELGGFCGFSTGGDCADDSGCITGGCSSQVCQSADEEGMITTCEYRECYDAPAYGAECRCVSSKCMWAK